MVKNLRKIVITGGPVGGKSEGIKIVKKRLREMGYRVFVIDEIATRWFSGAFPDIGEIYNRDFQTYCKIQSEIVLACLEEIKRYEDLAELMPRENFVLLIDRGPMDIAAYMPTDYFMAVLEQNRLSLCDVRDNFDGAIHLVSTADGAEEVWLKAMGEKQNEARWEISLEQTRFLDKRTQQVWVGTPHLRVIDNSTDWEGKIERLWRAVLNILEPREIERKFLLWGKPDFLSHTAAVEKVYIEQMYLAPWADRIRKRIPAGSGSWLYYLTSKIGAGLVRGEKEEQIGPFDYLRLSERRSPDMATIRKNRYCFLFNNQYYEVDVFMEPELGLCLMEVELEDENQNVEFPPFVKVRKEVTDDPAYSNYEIAKIK